MENEEKRSDNSGYLTIYITAIIAIITLIVHFVSYDSFVLMGEIGVMLMSFIISGGVIILMLKLTGKLPSDEEFVQNYRAYDGVTSWATILTIICGIALSVLVKRLFSEQLYINLGIVLIVLICASLGCLGWLILTKKI